MSNYVKSTDFASKDALLSGNPAKIIKGTEIDDEYNAIAVAVNTKADLISPTFTGTPLAPTASPGVNNTQIATTAFVTAADTAAITAERTATATLTNKTLTSPAINTPTVVGGTINNTPIGGTTPAAGAFTTVSSSGGITGNITGNVTGNVTGSVTGNVTGNILQNYLNVQQVEAVNVAGGTFTSGDWRDRVLNTEVTNTISGASLASNEITLPAGTYYISAKAISHRVNQSQLRLFNTSDSTLTLLGMSFYSRASDPDTNLDSLQGRFTIAGTKNFKLQHRCSNTRSTDGFGFAVSWGNNIYVSVEIWKLD